MSVVRQSLDGEKAELPSRNPGAFWDAIAENYTHTNPQRWQMLAMLSLHENCGWSIEMLARTFGHSQRTVGRKLELVKAEVASRFQPGTPS